MRRGDMRIDLIKKNNEVNVLLEFTNKNEGRVMRDLMEVYSD
jgi:hypothetical protein